LDDPSQNAKKTNETENLAADAYETKQASGQTARGCSARCVRALCYRQLILKHRVALTD